MFEIQYYLDMWQVDQLEIQTAGTTDFDDTSTSHWFPPRNTSTVKKIWIIIHTNTSIKMY